MMLMLTTTCFFTRAVWAEGRVAHAFDPFIQKHLPDSREHTADEVRMLQQMGGGAQSLQGEAAHRPHWRNEVYPVVFGQPGAPQEVLVLLDFGVSQSRYVWEEVVQASRELSPRQCKIAVFGHSRENYGTDLMGLAIWISHARPGQAMPFLSYALERWHAIKQGQRRQGGEKRFVSPYDATLKATDFPIHYSYFSRLRPPVPARQELTVSKYCYEAGNVNTYQAVQISRYYGVKRLPAVIVNGRILSSITAQSIIKAVGT